jgi:hypothetical protein
MLNQGCGVSLSPMLKLVKFCMAKLVEELGGMVWRKAGEFAVMPPLA